MAKPESSLSHMAQSQVLRGSDLAARLSHASRNSVLVRVASSARLMLGAMSCLLLTDRRNNGHAGLSQFVPCICHFARHCRAFLLKNNQKSHQHADRAHIPKGKHRRIFRASTLSTMLLTECLIIFGLHLAATSANRMRERYGVPQTRPFACGQPNVVLTGYPPYHPLVLQQGYDPASVEADLRQDAARIRAAGYNYRSMW